MAEQTIVENVTADEKILLTKYRAIDKREQFVISDILRKLYANRNVLYIDTYREAKQE